MTGNRFSAVTLPSLIAHHARSKPDATAFVDVESDERCSWSDFDCVVNRVANALTARSVAGTRVGLLSHGSLWAYAAYFGVLRAGATIAPLSPMWTAEMLSRTVERAKVEILFVGADLWPLAEEVRSAVPSVEVVVDDGVSLLFSTSPQSDPGVNVTFGDPYSVIYSSGTTGTPKGIVHSHGARFAMAAELTTRFSATPESRHVLAIPPFSNGSNLVLLPAVFAGGTTVLLRSFSPDAFLDVVEQHRPTHVFMVPTQFHVVLGSDRTDNVDWSSFDALVTAGAPMPPALRDAVLGRISPNLYELWGLTEGVGTTISPDEWLAHPGSVGRARPGTDLRLIGPEGGEVRRGPGEIVGRTAMLMDEYLDAPDATAAAQWTSPEGETYLRTGDLGEMDENGYLRIRGRIKDMIISGGLNVYPADIEAALVSHPAVADVSVVGVGDEKWGERPVAFVVPAEGAFDAEAVRAEVNATLAIPQRLAAVLEVPGDLPRNALGKVLKGELRERYSASIRKSAAS